MVACVVLDGVWLMSVQHARPDAGVQDLYDLGGAGGKIRKDADLDDDEDGAVQASAAQRAAPLTSAGQTRGTDRCRQRIRRL